ncbi:MAG: hypothetical protein L7H07_02865 [Candidatus Nanopusillus sp.]|nr:hypothetical protein [Candidatus Nanopusillus sp.]
MEFFLNAPPPINGCLIKGSDLKKLFLFAKEVLGILVIKGEKVIMINSKEERAVVGKCKSSKRQCTVFMSYFFGDIEYVINQINDGELYAINFERYEGELTVEEVLTGKVILSISGKLIE